jgi:hypothetical protein
MAVAAVRLVVSPSLGDPVPLVAATVGCAAANGTVADHASADKRSHRSNIGTA